MLNPTIIFYFGQTEVNFTDNYCTEQRIPLPTEEPVRVTMGENHDDGTGVTVGKLYFPWTFR